MVQTEHVKMAGSRLVKELGKVIYSLLMYSSLHAEYILREVGLENEHGFKTEGVCAMLMTLL